MNLWIEERAEAFRLALAPPDGAERAALPELISLFGSAVAVTPCDVPRGFHGTAPDGRALIALPRNLITRRQVDEATLHELAHWLLGHGAAGWFRQCGDMEDRADRQRAWLWEAREEREVEEFVGAWLIPSEAAYLIRDDAELGRLTGCSPEVVGRRREVLRGKVVRLYEPPAWCAWRACQAGYVPSDLCGRFVVRWEGGDVYEIPAGVGEKAAMWRRLRGELIALTPNEWTLKHARERGYDEEPLSWGP